MSTRFVVVVVGNVGIDTNIYIPGEEIDLRVESNFTTNIDCVGQAGGYSARGFAQLGKRTAFIGYVGNDYHGRFILEEFARDGIDIASVAIDPAGTSRSVNLMYPDGRRRNFYDGRGHMRLRPDLETWKPFLTGARLVHFNIPNWARYLLPAAREAGVTVSCDLQDLVCLDSYRQDFARNADILFFSAANHADPSSVIEALMAASSKAVVIAGMGRSGCALGRGGKIRFFEAVELDEPVVDTNGAGDGLAVGFLTSFLLDGYSLTDSILRGQIAARHTCTLRGSSSDLITAKELDDNFIRLGGSFRSGGERKPEGP